MIFLNSAIDMDIISMIYPYFNKIKHNSTYTIDMIVENIEFSLVFVNRFLLKIFGSHETKQYYCTVSDCLFFVVGNKILQ